MTAHQLGLPLAPEPAHPVPGWCPACGRAACRRPVLVAVALPRHLGLHDPADPGVWNTQWWHDGDPTPPGVEADTTRPETRHLDPPPAGSVPLDWTAEGRSTCGRFEVTSAPGPDGTWSTLHRLDRPETRPRSFYGRNGAAKARAAAQLLADAP